MCHRLRHNPLLSAKTYPGNDITPSMKRFSLRSLSFGAAESFSHEQITNYNIPLSSYNLSFKATNSAGFSIFKKNLNQVT